MINGLWRPIAPLSTLVVSPSIVVAASPPSAPQTPLPATMPAPTAPAVTPPRNFVGWSSPTSRWATVGKIHASNETVALDLDHPKTIGIFGYMGSGKSYLLGNLIESAAQAIPGINNLQFPLAVVVFNYRRNAADRFELSSLASANPNKADAERLRADYQASPDALRDIHVLCLPGELRPERRQEYGNLPATELFFDPRTLGAEDWELLMGEPGSEAVFARTIRNTLSEMRGAGPITFNGLQQQTLARLTGQSRAAANLRFEFVGRYVSEERGCDFSQLLRPGRVLVVDLRQPLFNKDDALRFFLVCANQISGVQSEFNKMIVFDEAHEYLSPSFGERMESRIRLMRHEGTSYVFATQDVGSIPPQISRFLTTRFVFDLGTRENVEDLERVAPDFRGYQVMGIRPGRCFLQSTASTQNLFSRPREVEVRPRVTKHGGESRIYSNRPPT
jgi:DNA helicase HerA-like ATPase